MLFGIHYIKQLLKKIWYITWNLTLWVWFCLLLSCLTFCLELLWCLLELFPLFFLFFLFVPLLFVLCFLEFLILAMSDSILWKIDISNDYVLFRNDSVKLLCISICKSYYQWHWYHVINIKMYLKAFNYDNYGDYKPIMTWVFKHTGPVL